MKRINIFHPSEGLSLYSLTARFSEYIERINKTAQKSFIKECAGVLLVVFLILFSQSAAAQLRPGLTFGHEIWPSSSVSNLDTDESLVQSLSDLSIWTDVRFVRVSYPMMLQNGQMFLDIQPGFQRIQFSYDNWTEELPRPTDAYIIDLNVISQRQLSKRWSLLAQVTPALKSGLEDKLASEDFAIEGAILAIRQLSDRSSYGFGVAYSTNFGAPVPIPLLQFDYRAPLWSGGPEWRGSALLPSSLEAWVIPSRRLEIGLQLKSMGDRHHITETGTVSMQKPFSDYFDTVMGPSIILYLTPWLNLSIDSGISLYRQMKITDGREEVINFEPDQAGFLHWQFTIGGQSPLKGQ